MKQFLFCTAFLFSFFAHAENGGSIAGQVSDSEQIALPNAQVQLTEESGKVLRTVQTSLTGEFNLSPLDYGHYKIVISALGFDSFESAIEISSSTPVQIGAQLKTSGKEMVLNVTAKKRNLLSAGSSTSKKEISQDEIKAMPQGNDISLPKLLASTTPGVVEGTFGQIFIRGNHANIQYQIDGVQLPESSSGSFGDSFSPRNIDHMEIITGGVPAEYGERLAAVMNIVTKAGPETPGGDAEVSYGSYNTLSPQVTLGGSNDSGRLHYFISANYLQTNRGLDTPQPDATNQSVGGNEAVHDKARSSEVFLRVDDLYNDQNKFTVTGFTSTRFYEIPIYPASFKPTDPIFQAGFTDQFGNQADQSNGPASTYTYVPIGTDDTQTEQNSYLEFVWKHTFSDRLFLQIAPYVKVSSIKVTNDPTNDLYTAPGGAFPITGSPATSFALDRATNNYGIKSDVTYRINDQHLLKTGLQVQDSESNTKNLSIQTSLNTAAQSFSGLDRGDLEALYVQDTYSITKALTLNVGLRLSMTQFKSDDASVNDGLLQPRVGIDYLLFEETKLHVFYGKLFQPAPFENLNKEFSSVNGGVLQAYDVKAEKDDYYEIGVSQQFANKQVLAVNTYYKDATNMIDDTQLLNTSITQPYNFAHGYADGIEVSVNGEIAPHLTEFVNYSYEDAKGRGSSGGIFAVGTGGGTDYQFLDHVQLNTLNAGVTYARNAYWSTLQGLYGSGLRTGQNNASSLPSHLTFDFTAGYKIPGKDWYSGFKASIDILNITDKAYPITIANGFNGSHYSPGREYFGHLGKEF